jgi:PAS domain S-box-containing protein/putative nucleotidyltransferase with HDIG domain
LIGTRSYAWDITDRKGAEVRQRESDERLRSIVEHAHDGILILDEAFHIIYANPESASISGYALEEIMGRDFRLFLDSESKNSVSGFYVRLLKRERVPPRHEFNIIRKDGQKRQVEVSSSVVPGAGGKLEIVAQIHDITAHQRALEELKTSEEKFKILFDYAPDAYYLNDAKGRLVDANKRAETMLGYKKEELIGKSLLVDQILAGGQIPKAASLMARNLLGHATGPEEFMVRRKDGSTISVEIQNYPVRMKDTTLILGIARDITERRQAEKAIRESEEKYRGVVERSNDGITIIQDGIIRYANPRLAQMWGGAPEELTGTPFHVHVHPDEARRMVDVYERRMTGEKIPAIRETVLLRKDGTKIYAELSGGLVDYQGKPANLVMVRDITERRRMEEELRRIAWMLCPGERAVSSTPDPEERVKPSHADLVALNTSRVILDAVGTETLENIVRDYVDLLDTSVAVYEANGDHAYAISSSAWCRFMRQASRRLCGTEDTREALASGKWLCHESCWRHTSKVSIETGAPVDVECTGGIRCYALPIRAGDEIVGAIKIGYGDPPRDESKLLQLAAAYAVNAKELAERASAYESRPLYVAKMAKRRLEASARLIGEIVERRRAESELKATLQNLRAIIRATVQAIATAVEVRDPYTAGHQKRVADLARAIAKEMGLPQDKIEGLRTAGVIHDLGKLSIPAEILSKPTKLTNIEFSLIQTHSEMGYEILKDISFPWPVARIVREHHERMDGSGYPQGLKGDEILIESRILAVADVVEAIASHRPYRPSKGIEAAIEEIQGRKGQAYDPDVVDACLRVFNNGYKFPALDRAQERVNPASRPGPPAIK